MRLPLYDYLKTYDDYLLITISEVGKFGSRIRQITPLLQFWFLPARTLINRSNFTYQCVPGPSSPVVPDRWPVDRRLVTSGPPS